MDWRAARGVRAADRDQNRPPGAAHKQDRPAERGLNTARASPAVSLGVSTGLHMGCNSPSDAIGPQ